jgi:hypothetical protein
MGDLSYSWKCGRRAYFSPSLPPLLLTYNLSLAFVTFVQDGILRDDLFTFLYYAARISTSPSFLRNFNPNNLVVSGVPLRGNAVVSCLILTFHILNIYFYF